MIRKDIEISDLSINMIYDRTKKINFMYDGPARIKAILNHFQSPTSSVESPGSRAPSITEPGTVISITYFDGKGKRRKR
ncbi:hypothetical protein Lal_00013982 [Lupinus albus]|nr:hypothetical protein Lal_00013982 [Lupinus albus]